MIAGGVDVVVPCYNYGRFLERCVRSILSQDVPVRVLILDDASQDDTPAVAEGIAARDSRVVFRRHPANRGHIATYNEGLLGWAEAEFSVLISADDLLAPGALPRAIDLFRQDPGIGMVYGHAEVITDQSDLSQLAPPVVEGVATIPGPEFVRYCMLVANPVPTPAAIVRTALQQSLGGYLPSLPHSGDMEMWMRFAGVSSVGFIRGVQAYYRWHPANMTHSFNEKTLGDWQQRIAAARAFVDQLDSVPPTTAQSFERMTRQCASDAIELAWASFDAGDARTFRQALRIAEVVYPATRRLRSWKWRLKSVVGPRAWSALRDAAHRAPDVRPNAAGRGPWRLEPGTLFGQFADSAAIPQESAATARLAQVAS